MAGAMFSPPNHPNNILLNTPTTPNHPSTPHSVVDPSAFLLSKIGKDELANKRCGNEREAGRCYVDDSRLMPLSRPCFISLLVRSSVHVICQLLCLSTFVVIGYLCNLQFKLYPSQNYSNPLHNISLSSHNSQSLMPSLNDSTIMSASSNNAHPNLAHGNISGSGVHPSPMTPAGFSHPGGFAHAGGAGGGGGGGGGGSVAPHSPIQSPSSTFNSSWTAASKYNKILRIIHLQISYGNIKTNYASEFDSIGLPELKHLWTFLLGNSTCG